MNYYYYYYYNTNGGKTTTTTSLLPLLLLLLSGLPREAFLKRVKNNEVLGCNDVMEALPGRPGHWKGMNGTLASPNYPMPYPARMQCRVDLKAPPHHRVRLVFTDFLLYHPLNYSNKNCNAMDSVTISESANSKLGTFCGTGNPLPIMSSGSFLSLVFRSLTSGPHVKGYRAEYTFLKDFGLTTGRQLDHHPCTFEFNSTVYPSGEIHSPNPGGKYPRDTVCHYVFHGRRDQRVMLDFLYFDIEGVAPCTANSKSDFVEFSNSPIEHVLPRRCGRYAPKTVESEGPYLRVTFRSDSKFEGMGFAATFSFFSGKNKDARSSDANHEHQPLSVATAGTAVVTRAGRWVLTMAIVTQASTLPLLLHRLL
ncbi:suppressor of lurcher protein 1-like [Eriocheir sinensis]|uniref:suppressor of lurcher protein 1-like n=1 Tax=Eriocheir sinensis TaxID=95602 RepID=UPI0021C8D507|nr:suppressor of lurcher protein 1-like [Eriocheir sinensis]XP_050736753.1 suppressor of lurcher protein 1-like [Eriocheir sinensis]